MLGLIKVKQHCNRLLMSNTTFNTVTSVIGFNANVPYCLLILLRTKVMF